MPALIAPWWRRFAVRFVIAAIALIAAAMVTRVLADIVSHPLEITLAGAIADTRPGLGDRGGARAWRRPRAGDGVGAGADPGRRGVGGAGADRTDRGTPAGGGGRGGADRSRPVPRRAATAAPAAGARLACDRLVGRVRSGARLAVAVGADRRRVVPRGRDSQADRSPAAKRAHHLASSSTAIPTPGMHFRCCTSPRRGRSGCRASTLSIGYVDLVPLFGLMLALVAYAVGVRVAGRLAGRDHGAARAVAVGDGRAGSQQRTAAAILRHAWWCFPRCLLLLLEQQRWRSRVIEVLARRSRAGDHGLPPHLRAASADRFGGGRGIQPRTLAGNDRLDHRQSWPRSPSST